uniref:Uncharacterized protein n=1 Tax=Rhizobium leguminosarum TaxID=384 RepID=A0A179BQV4_RHILE|nr:hypothetical protein A4U53_39850 [Rhizobium leguminosarum]
MTPQHLVVNGDRSYAGRGLEERNNLGVADVPKGVGAPPVAPRLGLRWKTRILLDPVSRRTA